MILVHSKIGKAMRGHFERLVSWYGRHELIPVYIEDDIFNFNWSKEVESTENPCCEQFSAVGKRWRSSALASPAKTLSEELASIGEDIGPIEVPRADVEMRCEDRSAQGMIEPQESLQQRTWSVLC